VLLFMVGTTISVPPAGKNSGVILQIAFGAYALLFFLLAIMQKKESKKKENGEA